MRVTLKMDQQIIGNDECNGKYKRKEGINQNIFCQTIPKKNKHYRIQFGKGFEIAKN